MGRPKVKYECVLEFTWSVSHELSQRINVKRERVATVTTRVLQSRFFHSLDVSIFALG